MKIIHQGTLPKYIKYNFACRNCKTVAIAEAHESYRDAYDPRDVDHAKVFKCPMCGHDCFVWVR